MISMSYPFLWDKYTLQSCKLIELINDQVIYTFYDNSIYDRVVLKFKYSDSLPTDMKTAGSKLQKLIHDSFEELL